MTSDPTVPQDPDPFDPRGLLLRLARAIPVTALCGLLGALLGAALAGRAARMQVASIQVQSDGPSADRGDLARLAGFSDATGIAALLLSPGTAGRLPAAALASDLGLSAGAGPEAIARRWAERLSVIPGPDHRSAWIVARASTPEAASRLARRAVDAAAARLSERMRASAGSWLSGWERESNALLARIAEIEKLPPSDRGPAETVALDARLERLREIERWRLAIERLLASGERPWVEVATQEPVAEPRRGAAVTGAAALGTFASLLALLIGFVRGAPRAD